VKRLLVLWDPQNPIVPVAPIIQALGTLPDLRLRTLTFQEVGHPTLPNGAFNLPIDPSEGMPDGILWIEGGPLPGNLQDYSCPKACWLINTSLEPSLLEDIGSRFDRVFSASLRDCAEERAMWLPLAGESANPVDVPRGISILLADPKPPEQAQIEQLLASQVLENESNVPIVLALGNGGQPHPLFFDCLRSGAAVVADPGIDLRGLAHVGEHLDVFPSVNELPEFLRRLSGDSDRLSRLSSRGPAVVRHLHEHSLRAHRILEGLWPQARTLSGATYRPRVSVLVTCHRYLHRFRVCLESLARQNLPAGALEIVVADPASPDGLAEALEQFAAQYPAIRVIHVPVDPRYHRNRGLGINRAFEASRGPVIIAIDGDIVFPTHLLGILEEAVLRESRHVYGIRRSFVGREETERILSGELNPFAEFDRLSRSPGDGEESPFVGVLGYCQAVHRDAFARTRYPEEFDVVNQSDIVFVERLGREAGVTARFLGEHRVLHLWHPRNWQGTSESL